MATFTQKDEFGRFFIDGSEVKVHSDMLGRFYGEAIDRLAEYEHGKEKTSCTYYVVYMGLNDNGSLTGEIPVERSSEIKTYKDILETAQYLTEYLELKKVIILNYVKIESANDKGIYTEGLILNG